MKYVSRSNAKCFEPNSGSLQTADSNASAGNRFASEPAASTPKPSGRNDVVFSVGDASKLVHRSVTTVKELLRQLRIEPVKTAGGQWILTAAIVGRLREEVERREREKVR